MISEPVGLGIGKYRLSKKHPFFIASVYHDGAWEAYNIFRGKQTFTDVDASIQINDDPDYYSQVVRYQYEHLNHFLSIPSNSLEKYIAHHDKVFYDICYKLARHQSDLWLKLQAKLFYLLACSYRKLHFRKVSK